MKSLPQMMEEALGELKVASSSAIAQWIKTTYPDFYRVAADEALLTEIRELRNSERVSQVRARFDNASTKPTKASVYP